MLLLFVGCLLVGIVVVLLKYSLWRKRYSRLVPGVTPSIFNVFGDLIGLVICKDLHLRIMDLFAERTKLFQKHGLMCLWFSYVPIIFLLKADSVKEVLKGNKMLDKAWMYEWMKPVVGDGLLTSAREKWKFQKRLLTPCFHADVVRNFMPSFNEESKNLMNVLQAEIKKDSTLISDKVALCLLDIASETIFGVTIGALKNENVQYLKSLRKMASIYMTRIYSPWMWSDFVFWKMRIGRDMNHNLKEMQKVTRSIIEEKRNRYLKGEKITLKGRRKAMLDLLLEKHLETHELSEEDIRKQVDLFLIAGHETVGTTVTWALFLLGCYPDVQTKVQRELGQVFGDDRARHVTEDDLQHLQYLDCVLKETLRLYPGIPIFAREASEDTQINGYPIPRGTAIVIYAFSLHRDPDVFPDPEKFDPDRFLPENSVNIPEFAYVPFSAGPRNCIGHKYVEMVVKVILSWIMRNFTVESLDSRDKVSPILSIGIHSSVPIRIRIRPRHTSKYS